MEDARYGRQAGERLFKENAGWQGEKSTGISVQRKMTDTSSWRYGGE
jgi:hypothetical protein